MTADIKAALLAFESPGAFAVRMRTPANTLRISVDKVGPLGSPITTVMTKRLLAVASRSPLGLREQTPIDPEEVRSGWQVAKSRIKIDGRRWNPVLRELLDSLAEQLGAPGRLTAQLDKLTIYGPGEFFKPHPDTEKHPDMIGTMIVLLPTRYTGGTLSVDRNGETIEFGRIASVPVGLEIMAFYADCRHEIHPVKSGHRVALVYQLGIEPDADRSSEPKLDPARLERLAQAITSHFSAPRRAGAPAPEKLVYLLDHQYTRQSLAWASLCHADALRAAALRELADQLGLDIHLALAEVHETWQCDPGDDQDDYEPIESVTRPGFRTKLIDTRIELRRWQDRAGKRAKSPGELTIRADELCFTSANDHRDPFASDHVGSIGNRRYHRAAIVLWPKPGERVVEAPLDPRKAIGQLLAQPRARAAVRERLERLLPGWPRAVGEQPRPKLLLETMALALALNDEALAQALLAPIRVVPLPKASAAPLLELAARYGVEWCQRLLTGWIEPQDRTETSALPWYEACRPEWLGELSSGKGKRGRELARLVADKRWAEARAWLSSSAKRSRYSTHSGEDRIAVIVALLELTTLADARTVHDSVLATLMGEDSPLSLLQLARVVEKAAEVRGIGRLARRCIKSLEAELARPRRAAGDWSIVIPQICACSDCGTLHEFLASDQISMTWSLARPRREHIQRVIDEQGLPLSHQATPAKSPRRLELIKAAGLAKIEARIRRDHEKALARLAG